MKKGYYDSIYLHCLLLIFFVINFSKSYEFQCPSLKQWILRANCRCSIADGYICLFDENENEYVEICRNKSYIHKAGYKFVIAGNPDRRKCESTRYQPFTFSTNGGSTCIFGKTYCSEEGQIIFSNGSSDSDRQCRCDYTQGYVFSTMPKHTCSCVPSIEDCSCYQKSCPRGFVLGPDYQCIRLTSGNSTFTCEFIERHQSKDTKHPSKDNVLDDSQTIPGRSMKTELIISIAVTILCTIIMVQMTLFCLPKMESFEDVKKRVLRENDDLRSILAGKVIPQNMRDLQQHAQTKWRERFSHFVVTRAYKTIIERIKEEQCLIISGPLGCGKSSLSFHIALQLEETLEYDFMIISDPADFLKYASEDKKQVFLIDDVFGKFSVSNNDMFWWKRQSEFIQHLMKRNKNLRLLMTSRLHIYHLAINELKVNFCPFNLISKDLALTVDDRKKIGKCYLPGDIKLSEEVILLYEFFPALCSNFYDCKNENSIQYFTCPVEYIKTDIENISKTSDLSYLALAVLIMCGNNVNKDMFNQDNNKYDEMLIFVSKELDFEKKPSKQLLYHCFIAHTDSYVLDKGSSFECLHVNLFNTLAYCIGPSIMLSILRYGTTSFITDRMQLETSSEYYPKLTILIPRSAQEVYFERMLLDMKAGFHYIFNSNQHKSPQYRKLYIQYMTKHLKENDLKRGTDGTTVLHVVSAEGYEDYVDFFLKINKPTRFVFNHMVNIKDNLGQTALHKACIKGHITIAKLLLDNKAYVDTLDNDGRTALDMACSSDLYATVEILLTRNATIRQKITDLQSVLHVACKNNNFEIAQLLLVNNANVNERDINGHTPLHLACEGGHSRIVDLLLKYKVGRTVDLVDNKGRTALCLAAVKNYFPIVQSLLNSKANPHIHTDEIRYPLHCACQNGSLKIATSLITHNASVDISDYTGYTPLYLACLNGHIEVAKLLLHCKADANKRNHFRNTPILAACKNNHNEIVKLLLDNNADINCKNKNMSTLLHVAVTNNNVDIILLLLKYGALVNEPDKNDQTPLLLACLKGYHIVAAELVKHGASINMANRNGETPIYISCKEGHVETVKMLLNAGANVNQDTNDGLTPLHMACEGEREHIVKVLLNAGVDLNMNFRDGSKQLEMVCKSQRKEIVSLVLKANAGVTPIDEKSPLYMACEDGNEAAVQDLLDECVNVNESNKDGITPLHLACKEGREQIVTLLIKAGVNVNQGDKNGTTPLQLACKEGNETIVKVLLHSVAYVNNSDNDGMTPLHVACKSGNKDIVTLLLNAGANVNKRDKKGDKPLQMVYMVDSEDTLNEESIVSDQVDVDDVKQINQINPINCKGERAEIAALLLDADTDPNNDDKKRENYADNIYSSN